MSDTIVVTKELGVQKIVLSRPNSYNAFNREMALALQDALSAATIDKDVRSILITGEGKAFSSGQDLHEAIDPKGPGLDRILAEHFNPLIRQMRALPKPIVMAVNGIAAGAGANIALAGDVIVASERASFVQAFSKIGLVPDSGGSYILPRLVGFAKASAWMMLADNVNAKDAERAGLIYKVFPAQEMLVEALKVARHLATQPTLAYAGIKEALNKSLFSGLDDQLELEREQQNAMGETLDHKEGVAAFMEKRPPNFKGK